MLGYPGRQHLAHAIAPNLVYREVCHFSTRLCALALSPAGKAKKLPWMKSVAPTFDRLFRSIAAKLINPQKELPTLTGRYYGGVTRPSGSLAGWRPGYTRFKRHDLHCEGQMRPRQTGRSSVGARTDRP